MHIYFCSENNPDYKMIKALGGAITNHFKGIISDIHRKGNQIAFTETLFIGGEEIKCCHMIPAESIVVVEEAPLILQDAWLKVGIATLLIPQMKQEKGKWGSVLFKYCGLLQVHQISVVTSQWSNGNA